MNNEKISELYTQLISIRTKLINTLDDKTIELDNYRLNVCCFGEVFVTKLEDGCVYDDCGDEWSLYDVFLEDLIHLNNYVLGLSS